MPTTVIKRLMVAASILLTTIYWGSRMPVEAETSTSVSFFPGNAVTNNTDPVTVAVTVENVTNLGSFQFSLNFDPAVVTVTSVSIGNFLSSTGRTAFPLAPAIDNTAGTLTYGAMSFGDQTGPSGSGTLATITFTPVGAGVANLNFSDLVLTNPSAGVIGATGGAGTVTVESPVTPMPSPTPTSIPSGNASLTLSYLPPAVLGEVMPITLNFSTTQAVTGVDVMLKYDPSKLEIDHIDDMELLDQTVLVNFDQAAGTIRLSQVENTGQSFTGSGVMAVIYAKPLIAGNISMEFDYTPGSKADTNAIAAANGNDILAQPQPLTISVVDKADLQVSLTTPSENPVLGHSVTGNLSDGEGFNREITTDPSGLSALIDLPVSFIGSVKTFVFKVSGYLTRRVTILVNAGLNMLNLGNLIAGDLNDDGTINSLDLSIMFAQWFTDGAADFNKDGMVNSADYWILAQNFGLKND
jgi:hypothetical protein